MALATSVIICFEMTTSPKHGLSKSIGRINSLEDIFNVLFHLGCYIKIPQTGQLINDRNIFLTVLEAESTKTGHVLVKALF